MVGKVDVMAPEGGRYQKQEKLYLFSSQCFQVDPLICILRRADKRTVYVAVFSVFLLRLNTRSRPENRPWFPTTVTINWRRFMSVHLTVNALWWEKVETNDTADFARGKPLQANQSHQESDKWFQAICVQQHSLKSCPLIYGLFCSFKWHFVSLIKIMKGTQWGPHSYSKCWQCVMPSG